VTLLWVPSGRARRMDRGVEDEWANHACGHRLSEHAHWAWIGHVRSQSCNGINTGAWFQYFWLYSCLTVNGRISGHYVAHRGFGTSCIGREA